MWQEALTIWWPWIKSFWYYVEKDKEHHISIIYEALCASLVGLNKNQCVKIYEKIRKLSILLTSDYLSHEVQGQEVKSIQSEIMTLSYWSNPQRSDVIVIWQNKTTF